MRRILIVMAGVLGASGAFAKNFPTEQEIQDAQTRTATELNKKIRSGETSYAEMARKARDALILSTFSQHWEYPQEIWKECAEHGSRVFCLSAHTRNPLVKPRAVQTLPFPPGVEMLREQMIEEAGAAIATDGWNHCRRQSPPPEESEDFATCMREIADTLEIETRSDKQICEDGALVEQQENAPHFTLKHCLADLAHQRTFDETMKR